SSLNNPHLLSPIRHSFWFFRVPCTVHGDLRCSSIKLPEIIRSELDGNGSDVLFKTLQLGGARNRNDPGVLCHPPCECDLSGCRILLRGERSNQIYQSAICLAGFEREAGETAAIVLLVKLRVLRNRPSEKSLPKGTERNQADTKLFHCGDDFFFRT